MTRFRSSALACLRGLIGLGLVSSGDLFGAGSTGSVTITGLAEVGQTLSAGNNLADADGLGTITYQWYRGCIPIRNSIKREDGGVDGLDGVRVVTLSSDGKHAYVTGTKDDAVSWYERNASTGALIYGGMLKDGVNGEDGLNGARDVTLSLDGKHAYVTGADDDAVSWYDRNASTGALTYGGMLKDGVNGVDGLNGAHGVTLSVDGNHVYVAGEFDHGGAVSWYDRNASTGALTYGGVLQDGVNGVDGLNGARDVTLSLDGNHAYVTAYNDDAVSWYERNASTGALTYGGMLKDDVGGVEGLDGVSGVTLSSDGKHAYVTGITDDAVSWYERNASTGALSYGGVLKDGVNGVDGLDGAKNITLSSDGKYAYIAGTNDSKVSWYDRNASTGALSYGGILRDGVNGVDGLSGASDVKLSADGKHVYVTGYHDDAVSWYDRNASTGALSYGGVLKDGVDGVDGLDAARGVTLSADGKHAYVTGYNDDAISWYERNASTGALTFGGMLKDGVNGVDGLNGARDLALSADGKHAYVTGQEDDAVSWYERNESTGALTYVGMLKDGVNGVDGLDGANRIALSSDGKHGYVVGQDDNAVSWYERNGSTGALTYGGILKDGVNGVDGLRMANSVILSSDGNQAYVTGYSDHSVSWYDRNASTGALTYLGVLRDGVNGVDGLKYVWDVTLSSDGKHAYVTGADDDAVSWYERNASTGALSYGGMLKDGVNGVDGLDGAKGVTLSADGNHAYVVGAFDDAVSWYERNASTGALSYGGMLKDGVNGVDGLYRAHGMILSSDGNHAYVTGENDDAISWYERNASTGALTYFIANQSTYVLTPADAGSIISVVASYTDGGGSLEQVHSAGTQPVNTPPVFTSPSSVSVPENQTYALEVNATDADGDLLTYSISGGADTAKFDLNSSTGALFFLSPPDFENPGSVAVSNAYSVTIQVSDGKTDVNQTVTINLTNVNEPATGAVSLTGTPVVGQTLTASNTLADADGLGAITYQWYRDGEPIKNTLKDGVNGVDGLDRANGVALSADGKHAYVTGTTDDALSWYERNTSTGALTYGGMLKDGVNGVDGLDGAQSVTLSADEKHAYVTGLSDNSVSWYERNASTGALTYGGVLNSWTSGVDGLRYAYCVSLSADGKHAYVTGQIDHSVGWYERNASTGALSYGGVLKDGVNGVDGLGGARGVTISVDGKHAYVTGANDNALSWYERNASTGALSYGGMLKDGLSGVDGLAGATCVTLSFDGRHAYVTGRNDNAVSWFERNASTGALTYGGRLKDFSNGVYGLRQANIVTLSAGGKHAYVTGGSDDAVSWYERNASTGALSYGGMLKDGVNGVDGLDVAQSVTLSSDGKHAYVTGYNDDSVSWFTRDPLTGALTYGSASDANYTLTAADLGKTITVIASYTDGGSFEHNMSSGGTAAIQPIYVPSQPNHTVDLNATVNLEMIWVEPGTFTMGSPTSEVPRGANETEHNVTLTKGFYLGKYEVTQAQYEAVMTGNTSGLSPTPSLYSGNPNRPVEKVSWDDVQVFLARLNAVEQTAGRLPNGWAYVLPTESQWEYACRAGTNTAYSWGHTIATTNANYTDSGIGQTVEVGQYAANPWGFCDMHGNVWEWSADWNGTYPVGPVTDPPGAATGSKRVIRGGSFYFAGASSRSAARNTPVVSHGDLGFRLAFRQITTPPSDLNATAPLAIAENQPIGAIVGEFNATDPDVNATLTYHLVSGAGDGNNPLFTLETNGTLKTATTFDYETNASTYSIRVQAKDEFNATVEGNFTVTLTNLNEPATGAVSLTGTPVVGQTLAASNTLADADGLGTITYQWYRDGQPILYGGTLKDDVGGVDGLRNATSVVVSSDGMHAYATGYHDNAVSWYERNASTGALAQKGILKNGVGGVNGLLTAMSVTLSPDQKFAYVVGKDDGAVSWFERNASSGALIYGGTLQDGQGGVDGIDGTQCVTISPDGLHAYATGEADSAVSWFDRNVVTGALSYAGTARDGVNGVDGLQGAARVVLSPDGKHAYVCSLVDDAVAWFERNASSGALSYGGFVKDGVNGVDGLEFVQSVTVSPDGKHVYATGAQDAAVTWFERNASTGNLTYGGTFKDGTGGPYGMVSSVGVEVSQDGSHAYVSWHSGEVSWFDRNASTGALTYADHVRDDFDGVEGLRYPWLLTLSPDGKQVYVAAWGDHAVSWFARDPVTGALSYAQTGSTYVLTPADAGSAITVVASYTDGGSFEHNVSSGGTASVQPVYVPSQPNHVVDLNATVNLEMIWVEPGTFTMGSPVTETGRQTDETEHNVTLSKGFYLGKYEVTQAQYAAVMTGNANGLSATPSHWPNNPSRPVEKVSWDDAQVFLSRLNAAEQSAGRLPNGWAYVLPTEAQWEYACRAGTKTPYYWGEAVEASQANHYHSGFGQTRDVGQYEANPWGLFDMHGNVWEWTADGYASYPSSHQTDPRQSSPSVFRTLRSGSWYNSEAYLRSADRAYENPADRFEQVGFRIGFEYLSLPPTGSVTVSGTPVVGQTLAASNTLADPDGLGAITYQWYRDGQPILYGGSLKDGANGVDGLDGNMHLALSGDGKHAYYVSITDDSVNWFEINASTGALSYRGVLKDNLNGVDGLDYASWLTISNDGKHVYVTGYEDSAVSWYDRNANTGALTYGGMLKDGVNGVDGLNGAWRGTFASDGKYLYLAGSLDNSVSWFERNATTGALTYLGMLKDGVNGVDGLAGAQNVKLSPDGNHAYVTGIKDHAVSWFDRNGATGILTYGGTLKDGVNGVDGLEKARNLTLSPDGLFVYVTAENDDAVSWYGRNASTGALTYLGHLKDGVGGIDNLDYPWEVTISSDGAFAYVDSIYENAITWFERNASTGALSYKGHVKEGSNGVEGLHGAGTLVLSGNGLHAYSGGHMGGTAIWFARDPVTGALSYAQTGSTYVPTSADAGSVITVTASYSDGGSFEHNVSSGGTAAIQPIYVPSQPNPENNETMDPTNPVVDGNTTTDPTNPGVDGNSTNEGNATVPSPVPDYFRPIVDTLPAGEVNGTTAKLHGALMDAGGQAPTERGFLLSFRPNPKENDSGVIRLVAESNASAFSVDATALQAGKKYHFRAYARNGQGTGFGLVETFVTPSGPPSPSWIEAQAGTAAGWWTSPWLGSFFLAENGWARHQNLGWVFPVESPAAGLWLWKKDLGWLWTDKEIYPFLYRNEKGAWLYFFGRHGEGALLFYDYGAKAWIKATDNR